MSMTSLEEPPVQELAEAPSVPAVADATSAPGDPAVKTFRGRTLEELLPQIREQLGPDAIVVRQRDGLMGGIGGFFQQRFVEVDAKRGPSEDEPPLDRPRIDVYDAEPATPESFASLLADAEQHADPIVTSTFAPPAPQAPSLPEPPAAPAADPAPTAPAPAADPAELLAEALEQAGFGGAFAARLQEDAEAHELPFAAGDHRQAARRALARRIPTALPHRAGGLAIAFAGAGSTACADALASAYVRAGRRAHAVATVEQARTRLERGAADALVALDLPPLDETAAGLDALTRQLAAIELDELLVVLPATLDRAAARTLLDRFAPLSPTGIALALDPASTRIGAALELVCTTRLPLAYVLASDPARPTIAPADAAALAELLLP